MYLFIGLSCTEHMELKRRYKQMNIKKLITIDPKYLDAAKALYKGGQFKYASDSAFVRDLLETVATKLKKRLTK